MKIKKILKKHKKLSFILFVIISYFWILFILRIDHFDSYNIAKEDYSPQDLQFSYVKNNWIKILDLKEWNPYQKWYYHWEKLELEIKELLNYFKNNLLWKDRYFWRPIYSTLNYRAKKFVKNIPKKYIVEMKWIADWAWVSFNDILIINVYDDLLNLAKCSSMIIPVKKWFNTDFYHTRNLDYNLKILAKNKIVLKYKTHISVWFPWYIWVLTWVWEKWISLSNHTSYTNEKPGLWVPTWFLYRKIVEESNNLAESKKIIENADRTIANNIILWSYKENTWIVAEVTNTRVWYRTFLEGKNALISTNYFLSNVLFNKNITFGKDRYNQYHNKLSVLNKINYNDIKDIISYYDSDLVWWWTIANRWTVQSVIIKPEKRKLFIANWNKPPVTNWDFVEIDY